MVPDELDSKLKRETLKLKRLSLIKPANPTEEAPINFNLMVQREAIKRGDVGAYNVAESDPTLVNDFLT